MPIASRLTNTGTLLVNGIFDEFTGAPVVDSSLQLWLDAGQTTSYPGTGTTWTDLSGNNNTGTLTNGPTYSSANGGSLSFDGVDDYVDCGNAASLSFTNNLTVSIWCSSNNAAGYRSPLMKTSTDSWADGFGYYQVSGIFSFFINQWNGAQTVSVSRASFSITNFVATYDGVNLKLYENGTLIQTGSSYTTNISNSSTNLEIGRGGGANYYWSGNIAQIQIYNRALTAAEIVQNYNALQSRYGLASITATQMPVVQRQQSSGTLLVNGIFDEFTGAPVVDSNLKLWLDAGQPASYPGTGTTWTDLSGSGFNGTLINGPTFSSVDGGSIVFDGTDDYVDTGDINLISGTTATVEVWVNCGSSQNQYANILDYEHSGLGFVIQQDSTTLNTFYFAYWNGSSYDVTPTITLPTNTWCQLVFVKSGTSTIGYLNSVNTVSLTGSANFTGTGLNLALGRWLGGGGRTFNGKISNTKIYNRALTADEITTNFNALRNRYGI